MADHHFSELHSINLSFVIIYRDIIQTLLLHSNRLSVAIKTVSVVGILA